MPSSADLDRIYADYYSERNLEGETTEMTSSSASIHAIARFLMKRIHRKGLRVLDYGASVGDLAQELTKAGHQVIGVEFSKSARDAARANFGFEFLDDLSSIQAGSVDYVTLVEVIEHLPAPRETLLQLLDKLKPGGEIFISTPNRSGLSARLHKDHWREAVKPFHLNLFTPRALTKLLKECGFSDISVIRFSPLTTLSLPKNVFHRILQTFGIWGGLRVVARKPAARADE